MLDVRRSIVPVAAAGLLGISCGGGGGGGPAGPGPDLPDADVTLNSASFSPVNLSIETGETVTWVNGTTLLHSITPDGHAQWTRTTLDARGETFRVTFDEAGTYEYYCEFHGFPGGGMHGVITVGGAAGAGNPNPDPGPGSDPYGP